jgi:hypothetical protein
MLYIECDNDEVLITALEIKDFEHEGGKFKVCNKLTKLINQIGLIDEDPGKLQADYTDKMIPNEEILSMKYYFDGKKGNKVIMLCPDLENWIITIAKECKVKLDSYNLPETAKGLHDIGKNKFKRDKLGILIKDLKSQSKKLQKLEQYLKM